MKLLDTIRKQLDSVEATNASKIYTPFTLFCMFFAVYFNADILGSIFLSNKWEIKLAGLKLLANREWIAWFWFSLKVVGYSISLMVLYGLAQASAAFIWGVSNWANTTLSAYANRSNYTAKSEYENVLGELNTARINEKEIYDRLGAYHTWKPSDISRLQNDLSEVGGHLETCKLENEALNQSKASLDVVVNQITEENKSLKVDVNSFVEKSKALEKIQHYRDNIFDFLNGFEEAVRFERVKTKQMSGGLKERVDAVLKKNYSSTDFVTRSIPYILSSAGEFHAQDEFITKDLGMFVAMMVIHDLGTHNIDSETYTDNTKRYKVSLMIDTDFKKLIDDRIKKLSQPLASV